MLARRLERGEDEVELSPVVDAATLVAMQRALEQVHVSEAIEGYIVDLVAATRESQRLAVGASPRGSLALAEALAREGGARRARLRRPRGREGGRGAGARAPADAAPGALGAARARRGRRRGGARDGADAARRGRARAPRDDPARLAAASPAYAGLAALGLVAGLVARPRRARRARGSRSRSPRSSAAALAREPELSVRAPSRPRARARGRGRAARRSSCSSPSGADRVDVFLPLPHELSARHGNPRAVALAPGEHADASS